MGNWLVHCSWLISSLRYRKPQGIRDRFHQYGTDQYGPHGWNEMRPSHGKKTHGGHDFPTYVIHPSFDYGTVLDL
jgi:hypothetical protein